MRWGIETSFRELKYTIGLTNLHSKNVEYICQEIYAKLILYNFCEIISANIILEERNRKYTYQLNYTMAIQICRHYLRQTFVTIDVEGLIKKELSPQRPHRQYQRRVIKKRWVSLHTVWDKNYSNEYKKTDFWFVYLLCLNLVIFQKANLNTYCNNQNFLKLMTLPKSGRPFQHLKIHSQIVM